MKRTQYYNRMRVLRAENVACMGEKRNACRVFHWEVQIKETPWKKQI
jgi:hypothetical protein